MLGVGAVLALLASPAGSAAPPTEPPRLTSDAEAIAADAAEFASSLTRRLVHNFSFEEAEHTPIELPPGFYRFIAVDKGFPPYGTMKLSNACAATGNWSFEFSLDTGSLSARVPSAVIPVLPLADYAITASVRTEGIEQSRAVVIAWLNDEHGDIIPGSRVQTEPINTEGQWQNVAIAIAGQFPEAVDLGIELQLVQPRLYHGTHDTTAPNIEDVKGKAWFDDVSVWQVPRVELSTSSPVNVIVPPEPAELSVLVRDLTSESLTGHLTIINIDGKAVVQTIIPSANDSRPTTVDLSQLPYGWYRADFDLKRDGSLLTRRHLEFAIASQSAARDLRSMTRFAVELDSQDVARFNAQSLELLERINCHAVGVPIWNPDLDEETIGPWADHLRRFIDALLERQVETMFLLSSVPEALARAAQVDNSQVIELLRRDPALWRPYLDDVIIGFGLQVHRWQLGERSGEEFGWRGNPHGALSDVSSALGKLIASPTIFVPWPAVEQLPLDFAPGGLALDVPYQFPADSLLDYASDWKLPGVETSVAFEPLPHDAFSPRQRLVDLALRLLYGWRAGFDELSIAAPWTIEGTGRARVQPDSTFLALQCMGSELAGMEFVTEIELANDTEAWLLRDPVRDTGMIIAWSRRTGDTPIAFDMLLSDGPITARDLFGNETRIMPTENGHHIELTDMPTFIRGISLGLAQFRAGFAFLPNFIEAEHKLHEHQVVLTNPWNFTITGTLHLTPPEGWRIAPRTHDFTMAPGQQLRVPVDVVLDRGVLGGHKPLLIDVRLLSDREYNFRQTIDLEVGLHEVDFSAHWNLVANDRTGQVDLIISQYVTNRGERPLNLSTYVAAPGLSQRRRMIGGLEPGQTIVRHFRIDNGAVTMAGKVIHIGVAEQNGIARLRKALEIPAPSQLNKSHAITAATPSSVSDD